MKSKLLLQIANTLLLNIQHLNKIGLLDGKLGIAIFLYHYGREFGKSTYNDYADELLDDVTTSLHAGISVGFAGGLSGIGWGINYLIANNFVEADPDEILAPIDDSIFEKLEIQIPQNLQSEITLFGQGLYLLCRIKDGSFNERFQKQFERIAITLNEMWVKDNGMNKPFWESVLFYLNQLNKIKCGTALEKELRKKLELHLGRYPVKSEKCTLEYLLEKNWRGFIFCNQSGNQSQEIFDIIVNENLSLERSLTLDSGLAGIGIGLLKTESK